MRKILSVIALCAVMPVFGATAYDSPNGKCYAENVDGVYNYVVYFENARPNAQTDRGKDLSVVTGLSDCVEDLKTKLNAIPRDNYVLLIGSADRNAGYDYNTKLADRRIKIVQALFDDAHQGNIRTIDATKGNDALKNGSKKGRNPAERVVRIVVRDTEQGIKDFQDTYLEQTTNVTVTVYTDDEETSKNTIIALVNKIKKNIGTTGVSVWKDKNGNFNGARFASDSIAGVVLGTAGGLITSTVIKKNQLKSGFSDIKCTSGGQVLAEYGDEFVVGRK